MARQRLSVRGSAASARRRSDPPPREEGPRYRRGRRQANVRWRAGCSRSRRPAPAEPLSMPRKTLRFDVRNVKLSSHWAVACRRRPAAICSHSTCATQSGRSTNGVGRVTKFRHQCLTQRLLARRNTPLRRRLAATWLERSRLSTPAAAPTAPYVARTPGACARRLRPVAASGHSPTTGMTLIVQFSVKTTGSDIGSSSFHCRSIIEALQVTPVAPS